MATTPLKHDVEDPTPELGDLPVEPEMEVGIKPETEDEESGHPPA